MSRHMTKLQLQKIIGAQLKELRRGHRMGQVELAKELKISQPLVSKIENGKALPDVWVTRKIGSFFGVPFKLGADSFPFDGWELRW